MPRKQRGSKLRAPDVALCAKWPAHPISKADEGNGRFKFEILTFTVLVFSVEGKKPGG
ncbi:hypothetical protein [Nitrosomonas communis]|uniref:hypothetical protein n=1 Tax=Nitrosomonas communis TaxID=44574 RepID=UPI003D28FBE3